MFLINPYAFGGYTALGVNFDGSNDWLVRGSAGTNFTGISDGTEITCSFWFKPVDSGGGSRRLFTNSDDSFYIEQTDAELINVFVGSTTGATLCFCRSSALSYDVWNHVAFSFDAGTATPQLYINGSSDLTNIDTPATGTINLNSSTGTPSVGAAANGADKTTSDMADIWFGTTRLDWSDSAVMAKFRTVAGKPVNLGADGSTPTGSAPIGYFSRRDTVASSFATNKGTGGGMTINGTLTNSSTSPST